MVRFYWINLPNDSRQALNALQQIGFPIESEAEPQVIAQAFGASKLDARLKSDLVLFGRFK